MSPIRLTAPLFRAGFWTRRIRRLCCADPHTIREQFSGHDVSVGKCEGHTTGALDVSSDWRFNTFDNPRLNLSYGGGAMTLDGVISVDTTAGICQLPVDGAQRVDGWSDKGFPIATLSGALTSCETTAYGA